MECTTHSDICTVNMRDKVKDCQHRNKANVHLGTVSVIRGCSMSGMPYLANHSLFLFLGIVDVEICILWIKTEDLEVVDLNDLVRLRYLH